jgi:hypothetical protein
LSSPSLRNRPRRSFITESDEEGSLSIREFAGPLAEAVKTTTTHLPNADRAEDHEVISFEHGSTGDHTPDPEAEYMTSKRRPPCAKIHERFEDASNIKFRRTTVARVISLTKRIMTPRPFNERMRRCMNYGSAAWNICSRGNLRLLTMGSSSAQNL